MRCPGILPHLRPDLCGSARCHRVGDRLIVAVSAGGWRIYTRSDDAQGLICVEEGAGAGPTDPPPGALLNGERYRAFKTRRDRLRRAALDRLASDAAASVNRRAAAGGVVSIVILADGDALDALRRRLSARALMLVRAEIPWRGRVDDAEGALAAARAM
jgi:hypothetical protein